MYQVGQYISQSIIDWLMYSDVFCHSVSESVNLEVLIQLDIFILLTKNLKDSFQKC